MRPFKKIVPVILYFFVVSCDFTTYVGVRNYQGPCRVQVTYRKSGSHDFFDKDSLFVRDFGNSKIDSVIIRTNTSSDSYFFIAPGEKETGLMPNSVNEQPIKQVEIFNASDTPWIIHLWERKEFKNLKKSGRITTKGFVFASTVIINNGVEK
jgi:hypothetical protein